jgi:hypothetical protein
MKSTFVDCRLSTAPVTQGVFGTDQRPPAGESALTTVTSSWWFPDRKRRTGFRRDGPPHDDNGFGCELSTIQ